MANYVVSKRRSISDTKLVVSCVLGTILVRERGRMLLVERVDFARVLSDYRDACALIGRKLRREGVRKILPNEMND